MFIPETYSMAVVLSIITMLCWGSWPVTQKMAGQRWRFELFYWDYVFGIVFITTLFAFTLGAFGATGNHFVEDARQAEVRNLLSAMAGGAAFNAANILFVAAIAMAGMAIAFSIGAGCGLVIGVLVNYITRPDGNAFYLFGGVLFIAVAMLLSAYSQSRISGERKASVKGIGLALIAGVLFGFFYRFVAAAMSADIQHPEPGKLGPYTATFCFGLGVLLSNFLLNTLLMKKPFQDRPLTFSDYRKGTGRQHLMGVLGGAIWGAGLVLSILSAGKTGFAVSFGLGQGNALVAAVWGVYVWKEFKGAPTGTARFLYGMFFCYIAGLLLIIYAKA